MEIKVSVVVPVYNVERYLDRCVQSLVSQSLKGIEIILVEDGSPDNCAELCDRYAKEYDNIRVVHKQNAGLGMACNSGIDVAQGEYIAFCDSDDWVDIDMYQRMYDEAISSDADVVYTGLKRVNGHGQVLGYLNHPNRRIEVGRDGMSSFLLDFIASAPTVPIEHKIQVSAKVALYRQELIKSNKVRFVSERQFPSEDLIFNVQVLRHADKVVVLPDYFYNYFVNEASISRTLKAEHYKKLLNTAKLVEDASLGICGEQTRIRVGRFLIGEARSYGRQIIKADISTIQKRKKLKELSSILKSNEFVTNYPTRQMPAKHMIMHIALKHCIVSLAKLLYKVSG